MVVTVLIWGVKSSLLGYVRGMADGAITVAGGAVEEAGGFLFPAEGTTAEDGPWRFVGRITLTGHGGLMQLVLAAPWLEPGPSSADGYVLSFAETDADPNAAATIGTSATGNPLRLPFAHVASLIWRDGRLHGTGVTLTADGADLFFGPYRQGTILDDLVIDPTPAR
jgi:Htaa